jgi:hypothetical protein
MCRETEYIEKVFLSKLLPAARNPFPPESKRKKCNNKTTLSSPFHSPLSNTQKDCKKIYGLKLLKFDTHILSLTLEYYFFPAKWTTHSTYLLARQWLRAPSYSLLVSALKIERRGKLEIK